MAGESAHFGLRERPSTPAIRPFELPPRLRPMLDRAKAGLTEPFRGIGTGPGGGIAPDVFTLAPTGMSLAPLAEAARAFLASLSPAQRMAASFAIDDQA